MPRRGLPFVGFEVDGAEASRCVIDARLRKHGFVGFWLESGWQTGLENGLPASYVLMGMDLCSRQGGFGGIHDGAAVFVESEKQASAAGARVDHAVWRVGKDDAADVRLGGRVRTGQLESEDTALALHLEITGGPAGIVHALIGAPGHKASHSVVSILGIARSVHGDHAAGIDHRICGDGDFPGEVSGQFRNIVEFHGGIVLGWSLIL